MRFQDEHFTCGPGAWVNVCRSFGRKVAERRIRALASTTGEGTDETGMLAAGRALGYVLTEIETTLANEAWESLVESLRAGKPVIVCVDDWGHWAVAMALLGKRVLLVDSAKFVWNREENGTHVLSRREFMRRWKHRREREHYGICVGRK